MKVRLRKTRLALGGAGEVVEVGDALGSALISSNVAELVSHGEPRRNQPASVVRKTEAGMQWIRRRDGLESAGDVPDPGAASESEQEQGDGDADTRAAFGDRGGPEGGAAGGTE